MFIGDIRQDKIFSLDLSHPIFRDCIQFVVNDGKSDVNLINNEYPEIHGRTTIGTSVGRAYRGTASADGLTYVNAITGNVFNGLGFTIAAGVIRTGTQNFGHIASARSPSAYVFRFSMNGTDTTLRVHSGSTALTTSLPLPLNRYTTIVFAKEEPSNDFVIYQDGDVFLSGNNASGQNDLDHTNIGRAIQGTDGFPFPGNIAWVGMWTRPLTSYEAQLLENPWALLKPAPPAGHFIPPAAVSAASLLLMQQSFRQ